MSQYNITKIIDGLFVSDNYVPIDGNFLIGNKVIRLLGWTNYIEHHQIQQQNIFEFHLTKNQKQVKFPQWEQLQKGFQFLQIIHEQMLCGVIYSQSELQASLICIMYLMYKFHWNYQTSYNFIKNKMQMFQFSDQTQKQLEKYQQILQTSLSIKLKSIVWQYNQLLKYKAQSDDEALIINTTKNKLRKFNIKTDAVHRITKKPRIKWYDQIRPSSAKYLNINKNSRVSLNKPKYTSPTNQLSQTQMSIFHDFNNFNKNSQILHQSLNSKSITIRNITQKKENWDQDSEYLQLKQMSRTNFNDKKYMTSSQIRRRGSLKNQKDKSNKHSQNDANTHSSINLHNINTILGIYSNSNSNNSKGLIKSKSTNLSKTNAQSFLNNLKSFNKTTFSNS